MTGSPPRRRGLGCMATAAVALAGVLLVALVAGLVASRYVPLVDDAGALRDGAQRLAADLRRLEVSDLERDTIDDLRTRLDELDSRLEPLRDGLGDPLVQAARLLPPLTVQVDAADSLLGAAGSFVEAGGIGLDLAEQVVELREANESDPGFELLPALVELMATSGDEADRVDALIAEAQADLDAIPAGALAQIRDARDLVAEPLETYLPLLDEYRRLDGILPGLLGWGGERRYLVLAQNPAELRPAGGYAGTVGLLVLRDGALVEQSFQNVYDLDLQRDLPFVEPPEELVEYLLAPDEEGNPQSWRLADAAWSPDFPSGARTAAEFYAIEADGVQVDGIIAITTYGLDRLLEVVGAVDVPRYDVTVEPGDVTLTLLGATRGAPGDLAGRKDVLDALARTLLSRLLSAPLEQWVPLVGALEEIGRERMALVWLVDEEAQEMVEELGWAGPVRDDPGDYLYVVESNVAPTSKYNLVVDRADTLVVKLDEEGSARNSLRLDWQNDAAREGEPFASLREFSENQEGWYGAYVRTLVPAGSEVLAVSGEAFEPVREVERVTEEAGRLALANYLLITPGTATLTYLWTVPGAAERVGDAWEYRLVIQKQPGARTLPVSVRVDLPEGASGVEASEGMVVDGERVRYEAELDGDIELVVRYRLPDGG